MSRLRGRACQRSAASLRRPADDPVALGGRRHLTVPHPAVAEAIVEEEHGRSLAPYLMLHGHGCSVGRMIDIPDEFAEGTIAREGAAGRAWIGQLPGAVESHLEGWELIPDGPMLHGYV